MIQCLYQIDSYENEDRIYEAVCRSFEALEVAKDLKPGMKIVLKPNLVMAKKPSAAPVTTHPAVIRAVVRWLRKAGMTDITLAESSGGLYNAEYMRNVYRTCEMDKLGDGIRLNDDFSFGSTNCPAGFANHSFNLITPIIQADYIINLAKLKTHSMTGYSGGIKNLFGTIPGLQKPQMHYRWPELDDFSNMLLELAQVVAPQITILDAIDAMEGNGPTGGTSHPLHLLLAARDFYTQDYFAAGLMQLDPMEISMIRQAVERGLATPESIRLSGDPVPEQLTPFLRPDSQNLDFSGFLPGFLSRPFASIARKVLKSYPKVDPAKCIGCGKCAESCPPQIIRMVDAPASSKYKKQAKFQKKGCISCFCCQEMCPMKAISVKCAL